uniref:Phosphagen kinase C-terminal domain-containing protein n=1 Tax=Globodera pallida TaxID=36090 RepID=A0A183BUA9_GLOPA
MGTFKPRQGLDYEKNLSLLVKHSRVPRSVANGRPGSWGITAEGILEVDLACVRAGRKSGNLDDLKPDVEAVKDKLTQMDAKITEF